MSKISINQDSIKTYEKTERLKLKDGITIFRVLPPFGDPEVHNNYPYRRWSVAWLNDPRTNKRRPYGSPMSLGKDAQCPVNDFNKALAAFIEKRKAALMSSGASEDAIKKDLEGLAQVLNNVKVNHVYAYNVATKEGKVAVLEAKATTHKGIKKLMGTYIQEYGQDPTALTSDENDNAGVWFAVERTGEGRDTEYAVSFNEIKTRSPSGKVSKEDDRTALSPNIEQNYDKLGYDLSTLYKVFSYDDLMVVLKANLAALAETVDARLASIPGFELTESVSQDAEEDEVVVKKPVQKSTAALKTKLALDDDDMDDEEPPFDVTPTKAPTKAYTGTAKALADSLLDN